MTKTFKAIDYKWNEVIVVIKSGHNKFEINSYDYFKQGQYKYNFTNISREELYNMGFPIDYFEGIETPLKAPKDLPF